MNELIRALILIFFLIPVKLVLGQSFTGKLNVCISNCLGPQTIKLYSLEKEQLLLDEIKISGTSLKENFSLNLSKSTSWEEPRYLLSVSPLGMDIDIIISQLDSNINVRLTLPSIGSEGIYTSYIEFEGSRKAQEFYDMNATFWKKAIVAGKQRQSLLATNNRVADSVQVMYFNNNIKEAIMIIDSSTNLNCVNYCFYRVVGTMKTVKSYFDIKLYSKKELRRKLENFINKYPQSPMVKSFLNDLKPLIETIQW